MSAIGLDLGATWIRGVNLHPDGSFGSKVREPTPEEPKQAAEQLFELWERLGGDEMVGLAAAPSLDQCGRVRRWPNRPKYAGTDLLGAFLDRRCAPLILDDASAGAVAEHLSATEEQCLPSSTAYISVGTGVGGGIILHDQLWSGVTGQAMDVGHIPVPSAVGKECLCGGSGCLQTVASGRYLQNLARESGFSTENITELAAANARLSECLISLAEPLAEGILIVERLFEPQRIILGGGLMEGNILFNSVRSAAKEQGCITPVFKSRWGTWAGAVGAAAEALRRSGLSLSRVNDQEEIIGYRFAVLQGPNLNLLGQREPEHYGTSTIQEIENGMKKLAEELGCHLYFVQSNSEAELIEWLQKRLDRLDGVIINPAGLTAHGYALRDTLTARKLPFIEVHLSNIYGRETLHQESCFAAVAVGQISGMRAIGYQLALRGLYQQLSDGVEQC